MKPSQPWGGWGQIRVLIFLVVALGLLGSSHSEAEEIITFKAGIEGSGADPVTITVPRHSTDEEIRRAVLSWSEAHDPARKANNIEMLVQAIRNLRDGVIMKRFWNIDTGAHKAFEDFLRPVAAAAEATDSPLHILEVGSYEGASAMWMAENMLGHSESRLLCVDIWSPSLPTAEGDNMTEVREHFVNNIKIRGKGQVEAWQGDSMHALSSLIVDQRRFDIIYIDGSHEMADVATDALLAFRLLKPGGIMVFDDYGYGMQDFTKVWRGVDILVDGQADHLTVLRREYILVLKKLSDAFSMVPQQLLLLSDGS